MRKKTAQIPILTCRNQEATCEVLLWSCPVHTDTLGAHRRAGAKLLLAFSWGVCAAVDLMRDDVSRAATLAPDIIENCAR